MYIHFSDIGIRHHMTGSLTLLAYPAEMVRLSRAKCGRSGQYRKQTLIERYGADIRLPREYWTGLPIIDHPTRKPRGQFSLLNMKIRSVIRFILSRFKKALKKESAAL